jgi:arylesterase/paraoxonase
MAMKVFGRLAIALYVVVILVIVVGGFLLQLLYAAGQFRTLEPHFAGRCTPVAGLLGPEDVTIHPQTGVAYISAADRRSVFEGGPGRGAIYAYDLKAASPRLRNLTPAADEDFRPHGLSLYLGEDGRDVLYAINHAGGNHTIEVYDFVSTRLSHRESLSDPLLVTPNDLVAVGRDRLYVTNDHANTGGFARTLEDYLRRSISTVVYYDGADFSVAASGIRYPNGVNVSPDGRTLYVASTTGGEVLVFRIDSESGRLEPRGAIEIGSGVDNLELDAAGDLWIGAHPKLLSLVQHAADASQLAPSQIIRVGAPDSDAPLVEEVFLSRGDDLSGSSVGAAWGNRLLIGAVLDDHILDCRMSP